MNLVKVIDCIRAYDVRFCKYNCITNVRITYHRSKKMHALASLSFSYVKCCAPLRSTFRVFIF